MSRIECRQRIVLAIIIKFRGIFREVHIRIYLILKKCGLLKITCLIICGFRQLCAQLSIPRFFLR